MGIITLGLTDHVATTVWTGKGIPGPVYWVPTDKNAFSYEVVNAINWGQPSSVYKPPEAGNTFQDDDLPDAVFNGEQSTSSSYAKLPGDIHQAAGVVSPTTIEFFKNQTWSSYPFTITDTNSRIGGEIHTDEWYSYAGFYLLYRTWVQPFVVTTRRIYRFILRKDSCSNLQSLPPNTIALETDCGQPLPPVRDFHKIKSAKFTRHYRRCLQTICPSCTDFLALCL